MIKDFLPEVQKKDRVLSPELAEDDWYRIRRCVGRLTIDPLKNFLFGKDPDRDLLRLYDEEKELLEKIDYDKKGMSAPRNVRITSFLKDKGYSLRERVRIHGAGLTGFLFTTAWWRYTVFGSTDDWKSEGMTWVVAAISSLPLSIPTTAFGYLVGIIDTSLERRGLYDKRGTLEKQLEFSQEGDEE
jgi:hypothetical protein